MAPANLSARLASTFSRVAAVTLLLLAGLHCSAPENAPPATDGPYPGARIPPASRCLANACEGDSDCAAGFRCNTQLSAPTCQALQCGEVATICSSEDLCAATLKCHEGQCNPCTLCGDRCGVDFSSDPAHCGGCGIAAPKSGICVEGVPACADGKTDCDGTCVDLQSSPTNCGACGRQVGASEACVGGAPTKSCGAGEGACPGGSCRPLLDRSNCGNVCGTPRVCSGTSTCQEGDLGGAGKAYDCMNTVTSTQPGKSCAAVCQAEGLVCREGVWGRAQATNKAVYTLGADTLTLRTFACADVAAPQREGYAFQALTCLCFPRP